MADLQDLITRGYDLETKIDALDAEIDTKGVGVKQVKATTFNLNAAIGTGTTTLLTGTTQDVLIESVTVRNPTNITADATLTSFSIQSNDTTAQTYIANTDAVVASLTAGKQFVWTGAHLLKAGSLITITRNAAATGSDVLDIVVTCRAVVALGYLA